MTTGPTTTTRSRSYAHTRAPKERQKQKESSPSAKPTPASGKPAYPSRPPPKKPSISQYFSTQDRKKLEPSSSAPSQQPSPSPSHRVEGRRRPVKGRARARKMDARKDGVRTHVERGGERGRGERSGRRAGGAGEVPAQPQVKKPAERRQIKVLDMPRARGNSMQEQLQRRDDARKMSLRLRPDISGLASDVAGVAVRARGAGAATGKDGRRAVVVRVPDRFADAEHYRRVFEPLLLLECWAQIGQAKEEPKEFYEGSDPRAAVHRPVDDLDVAITEPLRKGGT